MRTVHRESSAEDIRAYFEDADPSYSQPGAVGDRVKVRSYRYGEVEGVVEGVWPKGETQERRVGTELAIFFQLLVHGFWLDTRGIDRAMLKEALDKDPDFIP